MNYRKKNKKELKAQKSALRWHFPDLDHGEADGLADPLLQYFEGNHEWYIARETIQNSLDARLDYDKPVVLAFEKINFASKNFPGLRDLKLYMKACLKQAQESDEKTKAYFQNALDMMSRSSISILKVSDFNTFGLDGRDDDKSGRWYRLVRSVGVNKMTGVGGGSFGIGKGAPIAASTIRTVFYSTLNEKEYIFQGRTRLITHIFDGSERRGTGFFGIKGYKSVRDQSLIPEPFSRSERGTDVYIIGYNSDNEDWRQKLAISILENFWLAIYSQDLEVKLIDESSEIAIQAATLAESLKKYSPEGAYFYYLARTCPTRAEGKQLPTIGSCKLYIKQDESYPKDIALMRKPKMVVKKRPFRILQDGYAGVFVCMDDKGNSILREMEPPEHDDWKPDLHSDRALASKAVSEMIEWIRETLRVMANVDTGDPEDIPGLDRFLPYEDDHISQNGTANMQPSTDAFLDESPKEVGAEKQEIEDEVEDFVQRMQIAKRTSGDESGSLGGGGEGHVNGEKGGGGSEKGESLLRIDTTGLQFRIIEMSRKKSGIEYCLIINPLINQKGAVNIIGVGDDANYPVPLMYAEDMDGKKTYKTLSSFIADLDLRKGKRQKIKLGLSSQIRYALGIENYEG